MAKIILKDGTEEYVAPRVAWAKVAAGEATFAPTGLEYPTRMMRAAVSVPEPEPDPDPESDPEPEPAKKRKRRTKAEMEQAAIDETD